MNVIDLHPFARAILVTYKRLHDHYVSYSLEHVNGNVSKRQFKTNGGIVNLGEDQMLYTLDCLETATMNAEAIVAKGTADYLAERRQDDLAFEIMTDKTIV